MMIVIMKLRVWIMIDILNTSKWYEIHRNDMKYIEMKYIEMKYIEMKYIEMV
jgi:hypothetical protein